jgi:hypothetical protein
MNRGRRAMIKVYDKEPGAWLGTVDEQQLQFLVDQLEEAGIQVH